MKNEQILEQRKLALNGNAITKLSFLSENRYVIITMDANGNKYGYFYDEGKLIDLKQYCNIRNSLSDILIDNDQNIWISSYGDGVFQLMLKKELISYMGSEKFLDPNIFGMAKSASGSMILLSRDYVYEYRDGKVFQQEIDNKCRELKSDKIGNYLFAWLPLCSLACGVSFILLNYNQNVVQFAMQRFQHLANLQTGVFRAVAMAALKLYGISFHRLRIILNSPKLHYLLLAKLRANSAVCRNQKI